MSLSEIKNNDEVIRRVLATVASGDVPHAYIVEAPHSVDKETFAIGFAQALLCRERPGEGCGVCPVCRRLAEKNHLDLTFVEATQKKGSTVQSVKDEDVEHIQQRLAAKPIEGDRSIAILKNADTMTQRACNRFLKTLEEPAPGTVILLLSENMNALPATIRSRCVHLRLAAYQEAASGRAEQDADALLSALAEGSPYYRLRRMVEPYEKNREEAQVFLDALEGRCGVHLKEEPGPVRDRMYRSVAALEDAREELKRGDRMANVLKKMILTMEGQ